jgi:hypothetical protein
LTGLRNALCSLAVAFFALVSADGALAALRVAVISDLNGAYGSTRYETSVGEAVGALIARQPDLVISTGDMVAGQRLHPPLTQQNLDAMWVSFHATVTTPLATAGIPLAVTPGNHDASGYAAFGAERDTYRREWRARSDSLNLVAGEGYPFDYAFAAGDVLFVSLDITRVGSLAPAQRQWLDRALTEHGGRYRHRVVFGHLPIYPFARGRESEITADRELERMLSRHGVEIFLSGHHHAFYPGFHGGIRHIGQACLGAGPRALIGTGEHSPRSITWLVFDERGVTVEAYAGPGFRERVDVERLPRAIPSRYGTLVRDDLRPVGTEQTAIGPRR